jgi:hypothetical protein
MNEESQLELANREFEQILPTKTVSFEKRLREMFQVVTLAPGLPQIGQRAYTSPGGMPYQTGPSPFSDAVFPGGTGPNGGEGYPVINLIGGPVFYGPSHPDSEPPIGPEERIRYSCVSGKCLQDPNGIYYGIDECLADGCGVSSGGGGGGGGKGCDCGCGPSLTVFKAQVTGYTGPALGSTTPGGRHYWTYTWTELTTGGRTSASSGTALNEYELSTDDDGDNDVPATASVTRKRIPDDTVVDMFMDEGCVPWFVLENPLAVTCSSGLDETLDGGSFDGV